MFPGPDLSTLGGRAHRRGVIGLALIPVALALLPAGIAADDDPQSSEIVERARTRLAQIDVSVDGPREVVRSLGPSDFELIVDGKPVQDLIVDHICPAANAGATGLRIPVSYLLYFEQGFLTQTGRINALELARRAIPELVNEFDRAMVISNGTILKSYTGLTSDAGELLTALSQIEGDPDHWLPFAITPPKRLHQFSRGDVMHWPSEQRHERLATVLGYLTDIDSPKILLYFADTLGRSGRALTHVVEAANAHGVRIITISSRRDSRSVGPNRSSSSTAGSLSNPTGGKVLAMSDGTDASKLVSAIRDDTNCFTLISFDVTGFPEDAPLSVNLRSTRREIELRTRDSIVVQSRETRAVSRLMAAFAAPDLGNSQTLVAVNLLPVELQGRSYSTLIQIGVEGSSIANATWDLGASVLFRGSVKEQFSGRVSVSGRQVPIMLEKLVEFRPGPFEISAVASETNNLDAFHLIGSGHVEGIWPQPANQLGISGPIAIVQTIEGLFVRDGETRSTGSRLFSAHEPLRTDRPAWALTLLCGNGNGKRNQTYRATHGVAGSPLVETTLESGPGCHQLRDRIDAESMRGGGHDYVVELRLGGELIQEWVRPFIVGPAEGSPDSEDSGVRTSIGPDGLPAGN